MDQLTGIATQWSNHPPSTPVLLPVTQGYDGGYRHEVGQSQQAARYSGITEFYSPQVMGKGRSSQPSPYQETGINLMSVVGTATTHSRS